MSHRGFAADPATMPVPWLIWKQPFSESLCLWIFEQINVSSASLVINGAVAWLCLHKFFILIWCLISDTNWMTEISHVRVLYFGIISNSLSPLGSPTELYLQGMHGGGYYSKSYHLFMSRYLLLKPMAEGGGSTVLSKKNRIKVTSAGVALTIHLVVSSRNEVFSGSPFPSHHHFL